MIDLEKVEALIALVELFTMLFLLASQNLYGVIIAFIGVLFTMFI